MIAHVSVPARNPRETALLLAVLIDGEAFDFPVVPGAWIAVARDGSGLAVEVYPEADKIGRQFKYAASRAVPFVTVVGDDEAAQGLVTLKNLATGEQRTLSRAEAPLAVKAGLPPS